MDPTTAPTRIEGRIARYLDGSDWVTNVRSVGFLAAGEYNQNYLVETDAESYVFRINHGTQLGLDNQIEYEYSVLRAVEPSGVTPRALFVDGGAEGFGDGVLLMEYIPGVAMEYQRDSQAAAEVFARIHRLPPSEGLVAQRRPIAAIAEECARLLHRHGHPHPLPDIGERIELYGKNVMELATHFDPRFEADDQCIVNTEVNSGNFIASPDRLVLVDWEKAVVSCRYQDLGHFLVPTTTLWKTDYRFAPGARRAFLSTYRDASDSRMSLDEIDELADVMEKTILLRAFSWCYMAYAEYEAAKRTLQHTETFERITFYLDHTFEFLGV